MSLSKAVLTRHVGFRVNQAVFETLQESAEGEGKQVSVWCREKIIEAANHRDPAPVQQAILAEVIAVEEIMIGLLYAMVTEGKPSADRFRQITSEAHAAKQKEARSSWRASCPSPNRPVLPCPISVRLPE